MRKTLGECRSRAVFGLSLDELLSGVDDVNVVAQQVAAIQLALVRQVDVLQVAAAMGATSTLSWLRDRHRISGGAASRLVKLARAVDVDSPTQEALAAGAVNVEQVHVITDAVAKLPVEHRKAGEEHLLGEAEMFGPRELGRPGAADLRGRRPGAGGQAGVGRGGAGRAAGPAGPGAVAWPPSPHPPRPGPPPAPARPSPHPPPLP